MRIEDIEKQEALVREMVKDLKTEILKNISDVHIPGVNLLGNTGRIATVSLSSLDRGILRHRTGILGYLMAEMKVIIYKNILRFDLFGS